MGRVRIGEAHHSGLLGEERVRTRGRWAGHRRRDRMTEPMMVVSTVISSGAVPMKVSGCKDTDHVTIATTHKVGIHPG